MKPGATGAAALAGGLIAAAALAAPALAQPGSSVSASIAPPAEQLAVTPGGVDMRTGQYAYSETDLEIGAGGDGGLALTRTMSPALWGHINAFSSFSHNWEIMLTEKRINLAQGQYEHGSGQDYRISIHFGGRSDTFEGHSTASYFELISKAGNGSLTWTGDRNGTNAVYRFQAADGTIATFRPIGNRDCSTHFRCVYVSEVVAPDGTRFTFGYDNPAPSQTNTTRLRSVTSNRGYALLFEYDAYPSANLVAKACAINLAHTVLPSDNVCPAGAPASSYTHTAYQGPRLASATNAANETTTFAYSESAGALHMGFIRPGETTPWLTNVLSGMDSADGPRDMVTRQQFATGESYSYGYDSAAEHTLGTSYELVGGSYTDRAGNVTTVEYAFPRRPPSMNPARLDNNRQSVETIGDAYYQTTPGPVRITDALGRTTRFNYCDAFLQQNLPPSDLDRCLVVPLQSYVDPEGIQTFLTYDGFRNVQQVRRVARPGSTLLDGSPMPDIVTSAAHDCMNLLFCAKPVRTIDANGNVTDYSYSPVHGGILTETRPAGPNGVRPETRYQYVQRHAWILGGSGGYVQAASPVWLLAATSTCRTSAATGNEAAPCATPGDEIRTTYDYGPDSGPNNLLLRGTVVTGGGLSARTCHGYDPRGRRISETGPGANLAACP